MATRNGSDVIPVDQEMEDEVQDGDEEEEEEEAQGTHSLGLIVSTANISQRKKWSHSLLQVSRRSRL